VDSLNLKDSTSIFPYIVDLLPVLVFLIEDGEIVYVNRACEELLGYTPSELIGKSIVQDLVPEEERPKAFLHFQRVVSGIREEGVAFSLKCKEGSTRRFFWRCLRIPDEPQGKVRIVSIALDATEFCSLAERVESLHKTANFSEFLRGLVHDFNNILNNVLMGLKKLKNELDDREKALATVKNLEYTLNSWVDLNRLLLDYSKFYKQAFKSQINLIKFLLDNLEVFQVLLGEGIRLNLDLAYLKEAVVPGDSVLWRYIFLNLLVNAKDAMGGEGEIFIRLSKEWDPQRKVQTLRIAVKDTGPGIPPDVLPHIFKPFFTTKEKGSGLGLYLVKHHITSLGGKIEVEPSPKLGTTFYIYVPLLSSVDFTYIKKPLKASLQGMVVFLFEDEEESRQGLKELLSELGAKVYAFSQFKEFVEMRPEEAPQVLLVDYYLPDAKGDEVYGFISRLYPEVKVLFLTGDPYALADIPLEMVLLKPFKADELLAKLSSLA
jgi:two-component system cell cycle sensor histidine kinase/response regulator CckA